MAPPNLTRATLSDLDRLAEVDARLANDRSHRRFARRVLELGDSWLATIADCPVGYALVSRNFFDRPFVDTLVISPARRRQGIGAALLGRCAEAHEEDRIFTSTNTSNAAMRALLARELWLPSGRIDNLDADDPELVFVKFTETSVPSLHRVSMIAESRRP